MYYYEYYKDTLTNEEELMTEAEKNAITKYDLYYESRMTKVESAIEHINANIEKLENSIEKLEKNLTDGFREVHAELKWLLGLMIVFSSVILAIMAHGFHWY